MRNSFEDKVAAKLIPQGYAYEPIKLTYTIEATYTPDFVKGDEIIEAKGYFPPEDRKKMRLIREQYPDLRITICFQNPNTKIRAGSKTSYADWCTKHGIEWRTL